MVTLIALSFSLALTGTLPVECQQTAVEPKSAIEIVRDLSQRLKSGRAKHEREYALELRASPTASKAKVDAFKVRIAYYEKKSKNLTDQLPEYAGIAHRFGEALAKVEKAQETEKDARMKEALKVLEEAGLKKEAQRMLGRPRKEVSEAMNGILAALSSEVVTQHRLIGELSQMITQQKEHLADCQIAADREQAAQRKHGGLNMAIFALDGALRLIRVDPMAK